MKRPVVLLPAGPLGWSSYHQIYPSLIRIWNRAGFIVKPVWFPRPRLDRAFVDGLRRDASAFILPLGCAHTDALWTLGELRHRFSLRQPAAVMTAADLTAGYGIFANAPNVVRGSDTFIVNGTAEADLLRRMSGADIDVDAVPLPVAPSFHRRQSKTAARSKLGLDPNDEIILFAGRISTQKNIHTLLWCFSRIARVRPRCRLVIAGAADDLGFHRVRNQNVQRYIHELSHVVVQLGLENSVRFVGLQETPALRDWLSACDVHVSLTLHSGEDFGVSIAQGLCLGAPTVVTRWGGGHDFVEKAGARGVSVHVTPNGPKVDDEEAVGAIEAVLNERRRRRTRPPSYLSDERILESWLEIGDRLTERNARRPLLRSRNESPFRNHVTKRPFVLFDSTRDPLYQTVTRIYARDFGTDHLRWRWNPLYDLSTGVLYDPISSERRWRWTKKQKEFINRHDGRVFDLGRLSAAERSCFRLLVRRGLVLPVKTR